MKNNSKYWIVTDLDGTLMDDSYNLNPAKETIKLLQELSIPVILCTSKTKAEVKEIQEALQKLKIEPTHSDVKKVTFEAPEFALDANLCADDAIQVL